MRISFPKIVEFKILTISEWCKLCGIHTYKNPASSLSCQFLPPLCVHLQRSLLCVHALPTNNPVNSLATPASRDLLYLSSALFFTQVNRKRQIHGWENSLSIWTLRRQDQLSQTLIHHRVKKSKVVPVDLRNNHTRQSESSLLSQASGQLQCVIACTFGAGERQGLNPEPCAH